MTAILAIIGGITVAIFLFRFFGTFAKTKQAADSQESFIRKAFKISGAVTQEDRERVALDVLNSTLRFVNTEEQFWDFYSMVKMLDRDIFSDGIKEVMPKLKVTY